MQKSRAAGVLVGMFVAGALCAGFFAFQELGAAAPYLASGVVGKLNFTSTSQVNPIGFQSSGDAVVDTVRHRLYAIDKFNKRVLEFDLDTSNDFVDREADHVLGTTTLYAVGSGPESAATFDTPVSLAMDVVNGRLFVSDSAFNRILVFDVTTVTNGEAAVHVLGQSNFTSSAFGPTDSLFEAPIGVAYDENNQRLYAVDFYGNRVLVFNVSAITDGEAAIAVIGQSDFTSDGAGSSDTQLERPFGVAYDDTNDRVFVGEENNSRVQMFDGAALASSSNAALSTIGAPDPNSSGTDTQGLNAFADVTDVAYDSTNDRLFVVDSSGSNRVMGFPVPVGFPDQPNADVIIGQPDATTYTAGSGAAGLSLPIGAWYDASTDQLYVGDAGNNRVMVYDGTALLPFSAAADNEYGRGAAAGPPVFIATTGNNLPNGELATLVTSLPGGTATDLANNRMFIADSDGNRVLVVPLDSVGVPTGGADTVLGQTNLYAPGFGLSATQMHDPQDLLYDATGQRLFVADRANARVLEFDVSSVSDGQAAEHVLGQPNMTSGASCFFAATASCFAEVRQLSYDTTRQLLFVADIGSNRILVFDVSAISDGEPAVHVIGQPDFSSFFGGTSSTKLNVSGGLGYGGLAYDDSGQRIFIADTGNSRVMEFNVASISDGQAAEHVLGKTNFVGGGSSNGASGATWPSDVAYASGQARLFVADNGNKRVTIFDVASITDGEAAVSVLGQATMAGFSTGSGQTGFGGVENIAFDADGNHLWVGDSGHTRIMRYDFVRLPVLSLPDGNEGTPYSESLNETSFQGTVSFTLISGALPPGLALGSIEGTPTTSGSYAFTLQATDDNGTAGTFLSNLQDYTITIATGSGGPTPTPGGGGGGNSGGGFVSPSPSPSQAPSPVPTEAPMIRVNDDAPATLSRLVRLSLQNPFSGQTGVTMRLVNTDQLSPADRDLLARQNAGGPGGTLQGGTLRAYTPTVQGWDLCAGRIGPCTGGTYAVYVQFYAPDGSTSPVSYDAITYAPASPSPTVTPRPTVPTPTFSRTPAPSPALSPTVLVGISPGPGSPTPGASAAPRPSTSPGPSGLRSAIDRLRGGWTAASAVAAVTALVAAVSIIAILLSAILLSRNLMDLAFMGAFALQSLWVVLGLKKRAHIWGTVYDSSTKHPVQFAKVELMDLNGRVLETRFADRDGRYGFLTSPEQVRQATLTVRIKPTASGYIFPPVRVAPGATDFIVYDRVYTGEPVTVAADSFLRYDLPMDRQLRRTPRFSEFFPLKSAGGFMSGLMNIAFWVGLILIPLAYWRDPSTLNLVILIAFFGAHALRMLTGMYRPFGVVRDATTGSAMPYALVTLNDDQGKRRTFAVSDGQGRYFMSSDAGTYQLQTHTPANVTPQRSQTTTVTTGSGWVKKKLAV